MSRLRTAWARLRSVPGLGRDTAVIAVTLTFCTVFTVGYVARQKIVWPFENRYELYADFDEAPAVSPGNGQEVRIAGVPVGQIVAASVSPEGKARLKLSLERGTETIYDNARLVLRPKNPLNDMYVQVDPGGPPGRPLPRKGVVAATRTGAPVQVDAVLQHLDDRTRQALGTLLEQADVALARGSDTLPGGLEALHGTLERLRPVAEALQVRRDRLQSLVTGLADVAQAVGGDDARLASLITSARDSLGVLAGHDADVDATLARLPGLLDTAQGALAQVHGLTGELDPALESVNRSATRLADAVGALDGTLPGLRSALGKAMPLIAAATPVVADLRPLAAQAGRALDDVAAWSKRLGPMTGSVVASLPDVSAFVHNTASVLSTEDANGPLLRGLLQYSTETVVPAANPAGPGKGN